MTGQRVITFTVPISIVKLTQLCRLITHHPEHLGMVIYKLTHVLYYSVSFKILDASEFGVPQIRKRVLMFAARDGMKLPDMPEGKPNPAVTISDAISDLNFQNVREDDMTGFTLYPGRRYHQRPTGYLWDMGAGRSHKNGIYNHDMGRTPGGDYKEVEWDKPSKTIRTHPNNRWPCVHPCKFL